MRMFTAITPGRPTLPPDLALLLTPIRAAEGSVAYEYVGRSEGVLLDEEGCVLAFIVRVSPRLVASKPRTLVAAGALTLTDDSMLRLSWTEAKLLSQPRLDDDLQPQSRVDGLGAPDEGMVPPGRGVDKAEVVSETLEGGAAGALLGGIAGLALGGPIGAAVLATFFALGGGLGGAISGAAHDDAMALAGPKLEPEPSGAWAAALRALEERLRDPTVALSGLVFATRFTPMSTTEERSEQGPHASNPS